MTTDVDPTKIGHGKPGPGRPKSTKSRQERLFDRLMNSRGKPLERIVDGKMAETDAGSWACRAIMDRCFPARGRTIVGLNLYRRAQCLTRGWSNDFGDFPWLGSVTP
jgi:hypothetical protein